MAKQNKTEISKKYPQFVRVCIVREPHSRSMQMLICKVNKSCLISSDINNVKLSQWVSISEPKKNNKYEI